MGLLLQKTLANMINFVREQPDGIIFDILDFLGQEDELQRRPLLTALRDEDFIGTTAASPSSSRPRSSSLECENHSSSARRWAVFTTDGTTFQVASIISRRWLEL